MRLFNSQPITNLLLILTVVLTVGLADAEYKPNYAPQNNKYIEDKDRGWFYYEEELIEEIEEPKKVLVSQKPVINKIKPTPKKQEKVITPEQKIVYITKPSESTEEVKSIPAFSAKWFRKYLPDIKDRAIDDPSEKNMLAYLYAQRVTFDKSTNFRKAYTNTIANNPLLDEERRFPVSKPAKDALLKKASDNKSWLLMKIFKKAGIYFVYDESCYLCGSLVGTMKFLESEFGAKIFKISTDGTLHNHRYFKDTKFDETGNIRRRFNIKIAPAFILVAANGKAKKIGEGSMMTDKFIDRILPFALDMGIISKNELNSTSDLLDDTNMADIMSVLDKKTVTDLKDDIANNPEKLIELFEGIDQ